MGRKSFREKGTFTTNHLSLHLLTCYYSHPSLDLINFLDDQLFSLNLNLALQTLSRQDKKQMKKRAAAGDRLDNFDDIGDIGEFERLAELTSSGAVGSSSANDTLDFLRAAIVSGEGSSDRRGAAASSGSDILALRRAAGALSKAPTSISKGDFGEDDDDDEQDRFGSLLRAHDAKNGGSLGEHKRKRAPIDGFGLDGGDLHEDDGAEDDDDGADLLADFARKKKEYIAKKKEHYTAEPRYSGYEEKVPEGKKRGITYEIMKNKGLTKHRKKEDRNARVKKRHAYDKAVIKRKGQVVEVKTGMAGAYGGETTGIKANVARSRKLGN